MKYVAAASDRTVSLRREPFWFFRIFVKCNIASLQTAKRSIIVAADFRRRGADQTTEPRMNAKARELVIRVYSRPIKTSNQVNFNLSLRGPMTDDLLRFR